MPAKETPAEVASFCSAHPETGAVELLLPDLNGILRGKRIRVRELGGLFRRGLTFPATAQVLDSRGSLIESLPYGLRDGDPDYFCRPIAGSLVPVPWSARPLAQCLAGLEGRDGRPFFGDTRHRLAEVVRRFGELGLTPVVAVEYEFYLLAGQPGKEGGRPRNRRGSVPGSRREAEGPRVHSLEDLHELDDFFAAVTAACAEQGIPAGSIVSEYGAGQFEVNLEHVPDAARAADHALLLRRLIRGVARRHGLAATFMAKPFAGLDGSGMHVHVSLLDREGRNVFATENGEVSPVLRHAVGGLLAAMPESFAIFAPNANSYRRIRPDCFAPIAANWGTNHRHVAVRLPVSDAADARFEHRAAGADCNPYLAVAAVLAGAHHGIVSRIEPPPMVREGETIDREVSLPDRWERALDAFDARRILPGYLGDEFCRLYGAARRFEADAFHVAVPDLDYEWYLPAI